MIVFILRHTLAVFILYRKNRKQNIESEGKNLVEASRHPINGFRCSEGFQNMTPMCILKVLRGAEARMALP
jgi:hypothetical protein